MGLKFANLLLFLLLFSTAFGQGNERFYWKGIQPLKSTRADVEKHLGKGEKGNIFEIYNRKSVFFRVVYAQQPCSGEPSGRGNYNVPLDTVLNYWYYEKRIQKTSELELSKTDFLTSRETGVLNFIDYVNKKSGITIHANTQGDDVEYLSAIRIEPDMESRQKMECK